MSRTQRPASEPRPRPQRRIGPSFYGELPAELLELMHVCQMRTRDEWRRLPLDALPPHAGPVLVFDGKAWERGEGGRYAKWVDDWSGRELVSHLEIDEIIADQVKLRRAIDGAQRAKLAKRIRRRWVGLVNHAYGYTETGANWIIEFSR